MIDCICFRYTKSLEFLLANSVLKYDNTANTITFESLHRKMELKNLHRFKYLIQNYYAQRELFPDIYIVRTLPEKLRSNYETEYNLVKTYIFPAALTLLKIL